jgi:hypothetical protein
VEVESVSSRKEELKAVSWQLKAAFMDLAVEAGEKCAGLAHRKLSIGLRGRETKSKQF